MGPIPGLLKNLTIRAQEKRVRILSRILNKSELWIYNKLFIEKGVSRAQGFSVGGVLEPTRGRKGAGPEKGHPTISYVNTGSIISFTRLSSRAYISFPLIL